MIRSMTGYGEADGEIPGGRLRVELRAVNHRYLNVNTRIPASLARLEPEIREWLRGSFTRGHVNCTVRLERDGADGSFAGYKLDEERVGAYLGLFESLRDRFGITGTPDLSLLSRFNDIIVRRDPDEEEAEIPAERFRDVVVRAAAQAVQMREEEGRRLQRDLEERLKAIQDALAGTERLAPERLVAERDRLRHAVRELLEGVAADEARIAQEIALLAERLDVNEELVRFRSHIELFQDLLAAESEEPVGKRLAFLVQEMHREANTIGSKANSAPIAHRVVAIKDEIERLREQVENVE
jgi:uncharacterized protein (TIGR00255 family)